MQRYAVVVDPLGTGQEYPAAFREAGVATVAVLADRETLNDPYYQASWHPSNFDDVLIFDGDAEGLARILRDYRPLCLVPGAETGVEVADALVDLVVPGTGNVAELAAARRDKWAMARAVRRAGIAHLRQLCGDDPDKIDAWLRATGLAGRPLVVKPPKSAGTDNVHVVPAGRPWRPFFDQIYGTVNDLGIRNDAVLVQEFADGVEYLVDSYSVDGRHGLVDVCRYTKLRRGDLIGIYDLVDFLAPDDPVVHTIWPYVRRVLDAVGLRNGCGHTEVIVTADGPRLIEVGARPAGGGHQMITKLATGTNHILRTVAHRVHGEFQDGYRLMRHVCSVVVNAPHAGVWRNAEIFADVASLPTYHVERFYFGTGDRVPAPAGFASFLGWVVLASTDRAAMEADYRHIKDLERRIEVDPLDVATGLATGAVLGPVYGG
jgi:biotin carboxylase